MHNKPPIIDVSELEKIYQQENTVLVDARSGLNAKKNYLSNHLKGALYVNLESDLSDIKTEASEGGRHPLPEPQKFAFAVQNLGINSNSHVVVYDDKMGANAAARFWWMMRASGHAKTRVLNGGFQEAIKRRFPQSSGTEKTEQSNYEFKDWNWPLAHLQEVENASLDPQYLIIDVRAENRFLGLEEPIDKVAGHIPGAINIPFSKNLRGDGLFESATVLRKKYNALFDAYNAGKIIVHCGSGVTACFALLAITTAGLETPKLYVGSWSEWSLNQKPNAVKSD